MPNWKDLLDEVKATGSPHDVVRRKYLQRLHRLTGRNVIVYYSGWLQKGELERQGFTGFGVDDSDKNGFMTAVHGLDRSKGLDLVLHTPGGEMAATESLVDYLRAMFGTDIRAIVPQLAMSAGTMIALSCSEIVMGKHSSLGPIDPQIAGIPAHGVIEEFRRAREEIKADASMIPLWQAVIAKYPAAFIGECEKAIALADEMVRQWLITGVFANDPRAERKANKVIRELGDHALTKSHERHISMDRASKLDLKLTALEDDDRLQEAVLTVHHACVQTLAATPAFKIIENHKGVAFIQQLGKLTVVGGA